MLLDIVFRNSTHDTEFKEPFFRKVLAHALEVLSIDKDAEVSVSLVSPQRIQELNKQYRNKDAVTDVLSFPLGEAQRTGYTILALGDIFICLAYARARAIEQGVEISDHLAWMTVHALLHLLGYDHEQSETEAEKMFALEKKILKNGE